MTYFRTRYLSDRSFCKPGLSSLLRALRTPSCTARKMCSEKNIVRRRPQTLMSQGVPDGPKPSPLKRKTRAADVKLPSQARNPSASNHGPMESLLHGTGRWVSKAIFMASPRSSIQLLMKNETPVNGQTTEKRDK